MSIRGKAHIAGAYEHPGRQLPDVSLARIHADVAFGALADAGLSMSDVDAYFCAGDAPGFGGISMADYLGMNRITYTDTTETGGSAYLIHVGHAAGAIAAGKCRVALITLGGKPRTGRTTARRVGKGVHRSGVPVRERVRHVGCRVVRTRGPASHVRVRHDLGATR